jgi:hypothetical protein
MNAKVKTGKDKYQSGCDTVLRLVSKSGDRLTVSVSRTGLAVIQADSPDENTILGSITVTGLTPQQAAKKSKGFWGKLWDKIKGAAKAVADFVTFDIGPVTCRPDARVDYQDGRINSYYVGVSCGG